MARAPSPRASDGVPPADIRPLRRMFPPFRQEDAVPRDFVPWDAPAAHFQIYQKVLLVGTLVPLNALCSKLEH